MRRARCKWPGRPSHSLRGTLGRFRRMLAHLWAQLKPSEHSLTIAMLLLLAQKRWKWALETPLAWRAPQRSEKMGNSILFCIVVKLLSGYSSLAWVTGPWVFCAEMWTPSHELPLGESLLHTRLLMSSPSSRLPQTCAALDVGTRDKRGGAGLAKGKCLQTFCRRIWLNVKQNSPLPASGVHQRSRLHGNHRQPLA